MSFSGKYRKESKTHKGVKDKIKIIKVMRKRK